MRTSQRYLLSVMKILAIYTVLLIVWFVVSTPLLDSSAIHPAVAFWFRALFYFVSVGVLLFLLLRQGRTLFDSREDYVHLFQLMRQPVLIHWDGFILDVNDCALMLLNAKAKDELIGRSLFDFIHDEYADLVRYRLTDLHQGTSTPPVEQKWLTLDGEVRYVEVAAVKITFQGKEAIQAIVHDLTDRRRSEELLLKSEKLSLAGQLAAGVAHEIRNPLTSLQGFLKLMREGCAEKNDNYADIMEAELNRIEVIVNEFLALSKSPLLHMKPNQLEVLVEETIALLNAEAGLRSARIYFEVEPKLPLVVCDANKMKQVLLNVLKNALESVRDCAEVHICVTNSSEGTVLICVTDNGVGIPDDQLHKLGEPFYTTKTTGNGLGLMVTQKIVQDHGGELKIRSVVGEGTEVAIRLPINQLPA